MTGVRVERGSDLMTFERILHPVQEIAERVGRDGDIFDKRHRPRRTTAALQRRHYTPHQPPKEPQLVEVAGDPRVERELLFLQIKSVAWRNCSCCSR